MHKLLLLQSVGLAFALVLAAPTKKAAGFTGARPFNNNIKQALSPQRRAKRDCASIPDDVDPDVLKTIYQTAISRNASDRVLLATFETCYVESHCNDLDCGDQDSVGVFQQRTSQGWGTVDQIMNVTYSTNKFLDQCIQVDSQQDASVSAGAIAQMVQQSDFPDRYEQEKSMGQQLLDKAKSLAGGSSSSSSTTSAPTTTTTTPPSGSGEDGGDDGDCEESTSITQSSTTTSPQSTSTPPPSGGGEGGDDDCGDDGDDGDNGDDGDDCDDDGGSGNGGDDGDDGDDGDCESDGGSSSTATETATSTSGGPTSTSGSCSKKYTVQAGDSCSSVADANGLSLDQFYQLNSQIDSDCQNLDVGQAYCLN